MATKTAIAKTWALARNYDGALDSRYPAGNKPAPAAITGLIFPDNLAANSDIRLVFSGAVMPSRFDSTILWASKTNTSLVGYATHCFFAYNDGTWHAGNYELGGHPHPCANASVDGTGQRLNAGGSGGTLHYMEMAGLGARDQIAVPGSVVLTTKDGTTWKRHALQITTISAGAQYRHRYWPDVVGDSTNYFEFIVSSSGFPAPSAPAFYWGTSDWRSGQGGANSNDETPNGALRGFVQVASGAMSNAQIAGVSACDTDAAVTSYLTGQGLSAWYLNMNPTPTDVTDKSGNGRNPSWANALRPTLFTG